VSLASFLTGILNLTKTPKEQRKLRKTIRIILGFKPKNYSYYELAVIHSSAAVMEDGLRLHNERLEFLGDSVLDLMVTDYLYRAFPEMDEGSLTRERARLVNRAQLNHMATTLGLDKLIVGKFNRDLLPEDVKGNTLEAFIGAIYLDRGPGYAAHFVRTRLVEIVSRDGYEAPDTRDYKSELFMWAQRSRKRIEFVILGERELEGERHYKVAARLDGEVLGEGEGTSKKRAQQKAAKAAITSMENLDGFDFSA
jgi:ribonuclease III